MKSDVRKAEENDEKQNGREDELGQKGKLGNSSISIWGKKGVKAGPSTPVHPWRIEPAAAPASHHHHKQAFFQPHPVPNPSSPTSAFCRNPSLSSPPVSARKLAAAVWEFQYFAPLGGEMHRCVNGSTSQGQGRVRRGQTGKDKGVEQPDGYGDDRIRDQPETASSLKRHIAAALMQHHRSMDIHNHPQQPLSAASYSSSLEMTRYNPSTAPSPTSSVEFKARIGESSYSLKTSTELLKVLNRIWSLEEQHASSVSVIKALKMELHNARSKIKELARDRQADRQEIDELMKQITEDGPTTKSKGYDRANMAVQSMRDELESERQLRKRSESLHRKLAHELMEAKSSFSNASKKLERERTSRVLLEGLCDEFAKGIKEYENEVHALRQKLPDEERTNGADRDRLILHVSEAWIDERMQMKVREAQSGSMEKYSVVDKLRPDVERFLQARQNSISAPSGQKLNRKSRENRLRRNSMESVPMNDVGSAPQDVGDNSVESDSHCFELNKPYNVKDHSEVVMDGEGLVGSSQSNQKPLSCEHMKSRNTPSLQVRFEEQMSQAISNEGNGSQYKVTEDGRAKHPKPIDLSTTHKSKISEAAEDESYSSHGPDVKKESNSNYTIDHLIRNQHLMSEGGSMHLKKDPGETSSYRNHASPVRQWMPNLTPNDPITAESSSRNARGIKDNTLKAKLLEARMKGQHSRLKAPRGTS